MASAFGTLAEALDLYREFSGNSLARSANPRMGKSWPKSPPRFMSPTGNACANWLNEELLSIASER
jgi:hypothetical protein